MNRTRQINLFKSCTIQTMDLGLKNKIANGGRRQQGTCYAVARALAAEGAAVSIASRDGETIRRAAGHDLA